MHLDRIMDALKSGDYRTEGYTKSNSAAPHQHWSKKHLDMCLKSWDRPWPGISFKLSGWCDIHTKSASDQIKEGYQQRFVCGLACRAASHWMITSAGQNWEGFFCILHTLGSKTRHKLGYCDCFLMELLELFQKWNLRLDPVWLCSFGRSPKRQACGW